MFFNRFSVLPLEISDFFLAMANSSFAVDPYSGVSSDFYCFGGISREFVR